MKRIGKPGEISNKELVETVPDSLLSEDNISEHAYNGICANKTPIHLLKNYTKFEQKI